MDIILLSNTNQRRTKAMTPTHLYFVRIPSVLKRMNISKATLYNRINAGLFPPSIPLGENSVGFLKHEVDAVIAGMALGEDMKQLVANIVLQRSELKDKFLNFNKDSINS